MLATLRIVILCLWLPVLCQAGCYGDLDSCKDICTDVTDPNGKGVYTEVSCTNGGFLSTLTVSLTEAYIPFFSDSFKGYVELREDCTKAATETVWLTQKSENTCKKEVIPSNKRVSYRCARIVYWCPDQSSCSSNWAWHYTCTDPPTPPSRTCCTDTACANCTITSIQQYVKYCTRGCSSIRSVKNQQCEAEYESDQPCPDFKTYPVEPPPTPVPVLPPTFAPTLPPPK
jgi:hypothetical protein